MNARTWLRKGTLLSCVVLSVSPLAWAAVLSATAEAAPRSAPCSTTFAALESEIVTAGQLARGGAMGQQEQVTQSFAEAIRLLKKAKFDTFPIEGAHRHYSTLLPGFRKIYGSPGAGPLLQMDLISLKFALERGEIRLPASELAELEKHFAAI